MFDAADLAIKRIDFHFTTLHSPINLIGVEIVFYSGKCISIGNVKPKFG